MYTTVVNEQFSWYAYEADSDEAFLAEWNDYLNDPTTPIEEVGHLFH